MTGVDMRRKLVDHVAVAIRLRACPGVEQRVGSYPYPNSARTIASHVRTGALPAYQPAGSFESRWKPNADHTGWTVHACYVGGAS